MAAYHAVAAEPGAGPEPFLVGWIRPRQGGPIRVLVGGPAVVAGPGPAEDEVALSYPPGARGRRLRLAQALELWRGFGSWTALRGIPDALLRRERGQPHEEALRPRLEDTLLRSWRRPFAWLLVALPVPPEEVSELHRAMSHRVRQARSRAGASQDEAVEVERLEVRHRELRQAESSGLWRACLLAGGREPADARQVSALIAGSADLVELPYVLAPGIATADFDGALAGGGGPAAGEAGGEVPLVAGAELMAALARAPSEEVPGLRLALQPTFDVTPEVGGGASVSLGQALDGAGHEAGELRVTLDSLNRHTFVCGATGGGKSQTVRSLLEELTGAGVPWLVVEPAKAEYRLMGARLHPRHQVLVIRPGDLDGVAAGLNPLEPEPSFPLQTHADLVRALFLAAFQSEEPFPQVLSSAIARCYEELGWDLVLSASRRPGRTPSYPTLGDLQRVARSVVEGIGYGKEVTADVRGFIEVRLSSLRTGTTGRFLGGGHPIDFGRLLARNVVLEIEDVGDDRDKAFLMGTVLLRLVEHLRVRDRSRPDRQPVRLGHVSVFEEAHRLLRRSEHGSGAAAHAVELFASLLAEIRAYGEGLIVAEQIPSKLVTDVIKNSAVKVVHRLPALDDREAVGATMHMTPEQSEYVVTLRPGIAAVFSDGMDFPILTRMPDRGSRETGRGCIEAADELVGRFSGACGEDCRQSACTLRQMREAERALDDPRIPLWVELAVIAHLTGWPVPAPGAELRTALAALPRRLRDCALAQAVGAAVQVRAGELISSMSPGDFGLHVASALRAQLAAGPGCPAPEPEWLGEPWRWSPLRRALRDFLEPYPGAPPAPAPDVAYWERLWGRRLPGAAPHERFEAVVAWNKADRSDRQRLRRLLVGAAPSSTLERAVGVPVTDQTWHERFGAALEAVEVTSDWLARYISTELGSPPPG